MLLKYGTKLPEYEQFTYSFSFISFIFTSSVLFFLAKFKALYSVGVERMNTLVSFHIQRKCIHYFPVLAVCLIQLLIELCSIFPRPCVCVCVRTLRCASYNVHVQRTTSWSLFIPSTLLRQGLSYCSWCPTYSKVAGLQMSR